VSIDMASDSADLQAFGQLAQDMLDERRRARRWSIFFRLLGIGLLFLTLLLVASAFVPQEKLCAKECTAVVEVDGELNYNSRAASERVNAGLQAAFKNAGTRGVVLRINSPGGSPVQAGQIFHEARRLRAKYPNIPLYAVVEDVAASGGYYVAVAADRIYVDRASLVGSIGVIMDGFGFTGTMEKLGVERRVIAAGANKAFLDPFSPLMESQRQFATAMLDDIHRQFIDAVKLGRGERIKPTADMFSGLVWNGDKAVELGLADGVGDLDYVAREIVKAEELVDFTPRENIAERFARKLGASMAQHLERSILGTVSTVR
jgi:protease-4